MKALIRIAALTAAALLVTTAALGADKAKKAPKPYPLEVCLVSGEKLDSMGEAFGFVYEGQQIDLCCKNCKKDFDKDPKKFMAKVEEAAKKVKPYKLTTCLVSDEKLGDMGEEFVFVYKGQEVKLCCKSCKKDFDKDPAKFVAKLNKK